MNIQSTQYICEYLNVTQLLECFYKLNLNAFKNATKTLLTCLDGRGVQGSKVERENE